MLTTWTVGTQFSVSTMMTAAFHLGLLRFA
jgi:hypothetical protein